MIRETAQPSHMMVVTVLAPIVVVEEKARRLESGHSSRLARSSVYKMNMRSLQVITFLLVLYCCSGTEIKIDLTVKIPPGKLECFWQNLTAETDVQMKYQVISGGDLDINVMIASPDNRIYHMEQKKTENTVRFKSAAEGDYKVCFDNSFSRISTKVVYFEVFIEDKKAVAGQVEGTLTFEGEDITQQLDITVQEFVGILGRSKENLASSIQMQTLIRVHEAKDRNVQEANFFRVNLFSCFQLILMMSVALVQVLMIQSLFADKMPLSGTTLKTRT